MPRVLFMLILAACASAPAVAEINVGESIDWLVVSRKHAAIGSVAGVSEDVAPGALWLDRTVELEVKETLRGEPPGRASFAWHVPSSTSGKAHGEVEMSPPAIGAEFLLFFGDEGAVEYAVDLAFPSNMMHGVVFSTDFGVLLTRDEILDAVQKRIERLAKEPPLVEPAGPDRRSFFEPPRGFLRLEVPEDSPAFRALWSGSACYLIVPADPEYLPGLIEETRSENPWARARAAWRLATYPGEETEKLLRGLLSDPGTSSVGASRGGESVEVEVFPVRQAAYEALVALGFKVDKPEGWSEALEHHSFD
ncbi:MAG: hypothetical protein HY720_09160 [Planctomycetes bacterium]|nr:hypothetical protein [Planctomycetota bacterium]